MSKQRQVVYNAVVNSFDHPSAETVLLRSKEEMPSINLATVYRNLTALIKDGLVKRVVAEGGDRFDKTLCDHAHFQCRICGRVVDVDGVDFTSLHSSEKVNQIESVEVSFKGVCADCSITN